MGHSQEAKAEDHRLGDTSFFKTKRKKVGMDKRINTFVMLNCISCKLRNQARMTFLDINSTKEHKRKNFS